MAEPFAPEQDPFAQEEALSPEAMRVVELLSEHWASTTVEEKKLFENVLAHEAEHHEAFARYGFFDMVRLAFNTYYGLSATSSSHIGDFQAQSLRFGGENGERIDFVANEFRSYMDQIIGLTVKNRPSFQAQATNDDSASISSVESGDTLVRYYYEQVFGERKEKAVVKAEAIYGKAWTYIDWDPDGGPEIEIEEAAEDPQGLLGGATIKKRVKAGEFIFRRCFTWQVASDPFKSEFDGHQWRIVAYDANRFDMIARYPKFADAIKHSDSAESAWYTSFPGYSRLKQNNDLVTVRVLLHAHSPALPEGRRAIFVGEKLVEDGPLPIDEIPLVDFMTCELDGTCFGISDLWNLIPMQQMNNQLLSDMATNAEAFGRPPIAMFNSGEPTIDELANGQKLIILDSPESRPFVLEFPAINDSHLKMLEVNRGLMQSTSGMNAVARGQTDNTIKSGAHAALYHAMAVENQSPRQAALDLHRERVANIILKFLKKFALHPQMVAIAGESERPYLEEINRDTVTPIQRVVVKTASPMLRTTAGRLQIAEMLRDWPGQPMKDPQEIVELVSTGQLKPTYNSTRVSLLRIRRENEMLSKGPPTIDVPGAPDPLTGVPTVMKQVPLVPVLPTDDARQHLVHHLEVLYMPDVMSDQAKKDACLAHIMNHLEVARNNDPYLCELLGIPMPPLGMGMPMGPEGGGPSDEDLAQATEVATNPADQTAFENVDDEVDDSSGSRVPSPAESPVR